METVKLDVATRAWNVDGSAGARAASGLSWIAEAERVTGRQRGRCAYDGCDARAEHGGHVWIAGVSTRGADAKCALVPICANCNWPGNTRRMQNGGSYLRAGVVATAVEMTPEMLNARRRFARDEGDEDDGEDEEDGEDDGDVRVCVSCGTDISGRPANHTVCLACFRRGSLSGDGRSDARPCVSCGTDISGRPANHTVCFACFRRGSYDSEYDSEYDSTANWLRRSGWM